MPTISSTPKTILVSGGSAGIGEHTARMLAQQGHQLVIIGRNAARCEAAIERIQQACAASNTPTTDPLAYIVADLSDLSQVARAAAEYTQRFERLDVLVNNAGGYFTKRLVSADGIEKTFALNHLNYFLLTQELLPILESSANGSHSRIVNVSSDAHYRGKIDLDNLQHTHGYSGWSAYSSSKLANVLFTFELARRLQGKKITANVLHPGFVITGLYDNQALPIRLGLQFARLIAISPEQGALTSVFLSASPQVEGRSGEYYSSQQARRASQSAYETNTALRLWEISAEAVQKFGSNPI